MLPVPISLRAACADITSWRLCRYHFMLLSLYGACADVCSCYMCRYYFIVPVAISLHAACATCVNASTMQTRRPEDTTLSR
ncbi:hypothetical protein NDU88_000527 [Pleurodeles waltl]|uniref:Secreted protein n=1 Tax=Pleurodeles waltl TaxID=8319 RepID=A0AAV7LIT9_PLEWA|nr:hypothetical protein NDU88_000527 [Pleurodeles waltl]